MSAEKSKDDTEINGVFTALSKAMNDKLAEF